jgi:dTDP-4-dehydrorhamnose reductase
LPFCDTVVADVKDVEKLNIIQNYDAVINCVGVLNKAVDADTYNGIWLNACLPHLLAKLTKDTVTKIIHLSTDCVFSGAGGGGYRENSFRSADTLYGRSKALGELNDTHNLTIRTSIVGPDINENGIGLFNWFMKQNGAVSGYTGAIWSGVTTVVLADAIHAAIEQGLTGLYHLTNGIGINKFELLKLFNGLRRSPLKIIPSDTVHEDKSLVTARSGFEFGVPSYADMVRNMGDWLYANEELYRHYEI